MRKLTVLTLLLCLFSCSVQKRHYQKGYFISWNKKSSHTTREVKEPSQKSATNHFTELSSTENTVDKTVFPAPSSLAAGFNGTKRKRAYQSVEDSCDVIIFKDGSEIKVRIVEIGSTQVKYRKCNMPDGPVYITNKTELFMIKYANGVKEVIKTPEVITTAPAQNYAPAQRFRKRDTRLGTTSLVFGILGIYPLIFIGSITAIIASVIQLNKIAQYPDEYGGEKKARAGLILGIVGLVIWILIIAALILVA